MQTDIVGQGEDVAIGMAQVVANTPEFAAQSSLIVTIVLCATLVYELVGPLITKIALTKSGEIEKAPKKIKKAGNKALATSEAAAVSEEIKVTAANTAEASDQADKNK